MRRIPLLLRTVALGIMLGALPAAAHAQSANGSTKPAMGAMNDTSAMKHDGMVGKAEEATEVKQADKMKPAGAKAEKGAMADPAKMSQP